MTIKLFEVRDEMTFVPVFAFAIQGTDGYLARRAGYGERCIVMGLLNGGRCHYDCYDWDNRTYKVAHDFIKRHWDDLSSGQVIDVEFILGLTKNPKVSEEVEYPFI